MANPTPADSGGQDVLAGLFDILAPLLGEMISATVREAVRRERHSIYFLPGTVASVDGPTAFVLPDTGDPEMGAVRLSPDIVEGSRVMIMFAASGQVLLLGPIPD